MASIAAKLTSFAQSPQARQLIDKARDMATKPENREKVANLMARLGPKTKPR
jgi:hypothetical protein